MLTLTTSYSTLLDINLYLDCRHIIVSATIYNKESVAAKRFEPCREDNIGGLTRPFWIAFVLSVALCRLPRHGRRDYRGWGSCHHLAWVRALQHSPPNGAPAKRFRVVPFAPRLGVNVVDEQVVA